MSIPRAVALGCALVLASACAAGPAPRDLSNADLPIQSTGAQVQNEHAITEIAESPEAAATLGAGDRSPEDRAVDARRQAGDQLTYLAVTPGMRVAELGAGNGYFAELLSRSVGASGVVWAQATPAFFQAEPVARAWDARLARPVNARVVRDPRAIDAPFPPAARGLDLVVVRYAYGELPAHGVDRRLLLANVRDALRPGGRLVVAVVAPRTGEPRTAHIEASRNARYEIERAGFRFQDEGRFLRSSPHHDDWNAAAGETSADAEDRFFLSFRR